MKRTLYIILLLTILFESCAQEVKQRPKQEASEINSISSTDNNNNNNITEVEKEQTVINPTGSTLETRLLPPNHFKRTKASVNSYSEYLRQLPLKPHGSEVLLYDGSIKPNENTYDAVIDMRIGKKDLHQCADAVMRLRAEYLWNQKKYDEIHFNLTNGFRVDYSKWIEGQRIVIKGNKSYWVNRSVPSNTYQNFWDYMELVFTYAGTLSLSKELVPVEMENMKIGDVFIWGGSPGHAILVIDMAVNLNTKETVFLLAQSYMPAQDIQILRNPNNAKLSPWYSISEIGDDLYTPEWNFEPKDLKRFQE